MVRKPIPASQLLQELIEEKKDTENVSLGEINEYLAERGFAILMILFSFPTAIPFPTPPGFTTLLGLPLLIFSAQMLFGMSKPFLPKWISSRTIKTSHLIFAVEKTAKYFRKLETLLKPRWLCFSSVAGEKIIALIALLCAISIALPIVFGNAVPSAGIFIMALGLLDKDGIVIFIGIIVSIIGLCIASIVAYTIVYTFFYGAKMLSGSFLGDVHNFLIHHFGSLGGE